MARILLVEDSEESKNLVFAALKGDYQVEWCPSIAAAREQLTQSLFDMIILDVHLPDGDGFQFYSALQKEERLRDVPVVFLTVNNEVEGKILGFSLGADDYISKPFHPIEFRARIASRLKKTLRQKAGPAVKRRGDLTLHIPSQRAHVEQQGKKIDLRLTPMEFKLLAHLMDHEDQIFSREQLLASLWGDDIYLTDRTVDTHIYALRKKLGSSASCIEAVYGQGYRFTLQRAAATAA